jgi:hypothetical protein
MKKTLVIIIGVLVLLALTLGIRFFYPCVSEGTAHSMMGECGGDMQGHGGGSMNHGNMASHGGHQQGEHQHSQGLSPGEARTILENHLKSKNNPDLSLGEISESQDYFQAEITNQEGSVVERVQVDKITGFLSSGYETKPTQEEPDTSAAHQGHVH